MSPEAEEQAPITLTLWRKSSRLTVASDWMSTLMSWCFFAAAVEALLFINLFPEVFREVGESTFPTIRDNEEHLQIFWWGATSLALCFLAASGYAATHGQRLELYLLEGRCVYEKRGWRHTSDKNHQNSPTRAQLNSLTEAT